MAKEFFEAAAVLSVIIGLFSHDFRAHVFLILGIIFALISLAIRKRK